MKHAMPCDCGEAKAGPADFPCPYGVPEWGRHKHRLCSTCGFKYSACETWWDIFVAGEKIMTLLASDKDDALFGASMHLGDDKDDRYEEAIGRVNQGGKVTAELSPRPERGNELAMYWTWQVKDGVVHGRYEDQLGWQEITVDQDKVLIEMFLHNPPPDAKTGEITIPVKVAEKALEMLDFVKKKEGT